RVLLHPGDRPDVLQRTPPGGPDRRRAVAADDDGDRGRRGGHGGARRGAAVLPGPGRHGGRVRALTRAAARAHMEGARVSGWRPGPLRAGTPWAGASLALGPPRLEAAAALRGAFTDDQARLVDPRRVVVLRGHLVADGVVEDHEVAHRVPPVPGLQGRQDQHPHVDAEAALAVADLVHVGVQVAG